MMQCNFVFWSTVGLTHQNANVVGGFRATKQMDLNANMHGRPQIMIKSAPFYTLENLRELL